MAYYGQPQGYQQGPPQGQPGTDPNFLWGIFQRYRVRFSHPSDNKLIMEGTRLPEDKQGVLFVTMIIRYCSIVNFY